MLLGLTTIKNATHFGEPVTVAQGPLRCDEVSLFQAKLLHKIFCSCWPLSAGRPGPEFAKSMVQKGKSLNIETRSSKTCCTEIGCCQLDSRVGPALRTSLDN